MAKVTLHPMIRSISGKVGMLVFYTSRNNQYARRYVIPHNPDTSAQKDRRNLFAEAVALWQSLPEYKKFQWNNKATGKILSGYNLFISTQLRLQNNESEHQTNTLSVLLPYMIRSHSVYASERVRERFGMSYNELFSCAGTGPPQLF